MSKYVREIDSIQELRNTPTSDAAAAHVRTPTGQSGIFVPMDGDPFGRGDDGAVALQASDGTWWVRKQVLENKVVNVKWFGAKGENSLYNEEIQDALSLANSFSFETGTQNSPTDSGGATLYFPSGTYVVDEEILMTVNGAQIVGEGRRTSIIKGLEKGSFNGNNIVKFKDVSSPRVKDILIRGDGTNASEFPICLGIINSPRYHIENVSLHYGERPINIAGSSYSGRLYNVECFHGDKASYVEESSDTHFFGCSFNQGEGGSGFDGLHIKSGAGIGIYGCTLEGNSGSALRLENASAVTVANCFFEVNEGNEVWLECKGEDAKGYTIINNWAYTYGDGTTDFVVFRNQHGSEVGGLIVANNNIRDNEQSNSYDNVVRFLDSSGSGFDYDSITVKGNRVSIASRTSLSAEDEARVIGSAAEIGAYNPDVNGNLTIDRNLDANNDTIDGVADVLGTLIQDLQSAGIIGE